jgi:anaerobic magnesium-protoporphyrin IX monomethyl ester cyclase
MTGETVKEVKVLLINLPYMKEVFGERESTADINPPLGISYIASHLRKNNISVDILDANALEMGEKEIIEYVDAFAPGIIGFPCTTLIMPVVYRMAKKLKKVENTIIVGGPHVSAVPVETLEECPSIDIVVIGEGEITVLDLATQKNLSDIAGIVYRDGSTIKTNPPRRMIKDLDSIEFPARDLLPEEKYRPGPILNIGYQGNQFTTIVTARGCTGKCTFCSSRSFWKILRLRSADNILEEVDQLVKKGIKHLMIVDDTFTCLNTRVVKFCNELIKRKYNLKWNCYARVNDVDLATLKLMKKAGCFFIYYGVESGSQEILNDSNKMITLAQVEKAIRLTKKVGIITNCSFIMGLPGETKETLKMTLDFAIKLNPHIAEFYIATPFPGTEMYQQSKNKGWLADYKWDEFTIHHSATLQTCDIHPAEIKKHVQEAYRKYYLRIEYLISSLFQLIRFPSSLRIYKNCFFIFANSVLRNKLP